MGPHTQMPDSTESLTCNINMDAVCRREGDGPELSSGNGHALSNYMYVSNIPFLPGRNDYRCAVFHANLGIQSKSVIFPKSSLRRQWHNSINSVVLIS